MAIGEIRWRNQTNSFIGIGTFSGFEVDAEHEKRIDYIFVRGGIKVLIYAVLTDNKNQRTPSDHLPVFVKVQLK